MADVVTSLRERFGDIAGPPAEDICYATQNRQDAVRAACREADLLLVVGSPNSSNSMRLVEVSEREGCPAYLIDDVTDIDPVWLTHASTVAVSAGASAPESIVQTVVAALSSLGPTEVVTRTVTDENVRFRLPAEVR